MKVSRSSYYKWLHTPESSRKKEDKSLTEQIKALFQASRNSYGSRRIRRKLLNEGVTISRRRVVRLMQEANLTCKTKYKYINIYLMLTSIVTFPNRLTIVNVLFLCY